MKISTYQNKIQQLKSSYLEWIPFGRSEYQMTADIDWTITVANDGGWVVYTTDHEPEDIDGQTEFAQEWGYDMVDDLRFKDKSAAMAFAEDFAQLWADYQKQNYDASDIHQAPVHHLIFV
jgi:hypothetical protein